MKKKFVSLISIFVIGYVLTSCKSNENDYISNTVNNVGNESMTQNETCKTVTESTSSNFQELDNNQMTQITDSDTEVYAMSADDFINTTVPETDLTITISEKEVVSSTISKEVEPLQEDSIIMSTEDKQQKSTPIVLISIYESWAYGFEQDITVLDYDGQYYNYQTYDETEKIDIIEDEWYNKILEIDPIKNDENYIRVNEESMKVITEFSEQLVNYRDCDMKEYSDLEEYDAGILSVYGVYYDKEGIPQYVKLCSYGEKVNCVDNKDVIDFVNQMSFTNDMRYIFYDGFKARFQY